MACPMQMGLNPSHQLTEDIIHERQLPEYIGDRWRDLARALTFNQAKIDAIEKDKGGSIKECCIAVLVRWMSRESRDATIGKLADALEKIELKNVADKLMCVNADQNDESKKTLTDMETNCECCKMRRTIQDLEEKLSNSEHENSKMRARIKELEKQLQDCKQEGISDATREREISVRLKNINEKLGIYVTPLLQVPEVKEDKLKTAVKLDLLTKLSVSLQDMYSELLAMATETCKCNEDLKREFYDFAYHGIRAEHNDLLPRVKDLESSQAEMSDEEKKEFERLKQYQINRQRQVDRLENLWRGLFSSPESLPEASSSVPSKGSGNSEKASSRKNTDPGAKQKFLEPTPAGDDDKCKVYLPKFNKQKKPAAVKNIFTRKESKENTCLPVSYAHRDS